MTALEICQQALIEIGLSSIPTTLLGNATDVRRVRSLLLAESRFLRNQRFFPQAKRVYNFTASANRVKYPLPQDFFTPISGTLWDQTNRWQLDGPLSDEDFVNKKLGNISAGTIPSFRVGGIDSNNNTIGGQFEIYPQPAVGTVFYFEYITKHLFLPPNWTPSTVISANSYRNSDGKIYFTTAGGTSGTTPPSATSSIPVDGTITWTLFLGAYENIINDADLTIYDEELLISGIKWRYEKSTGTSFDINPQTGIPVLHHRLIDSALNRFDGEKKLSLTKSTKSNQQISEGSWNI